MRTHKLPSHSRPCSPWLHQGSVHTSLNIQAADWQIHEFSFLLKNNCHIGVEGRAKIYCASILGQTEAVHKLPCWTFKLIPWGRYYRGSCRKSNYGGNKVQIVEFCFHCNFRGDERDLIYDVHCGWMVTPVSVLRKTVGRVPMHKQAGISEHEGNRTHKGMSCWRTHPMLCSPSCVPWQGAMTAQRRVWVPHISYHWSWAKPSACGAVPFF